MPVFKAAVKQSLDITYLACLALCVGVLSGLGAVGFSYLIGFFQHRPAPGGGLPGGGGYRHQK